MKECDGSLDLHGRCSRRRGHARLGRERDWYGLAHGGRLVAIFPQLPDGSLSTAEKNALTFDVLSDIGSAGAGLYGLVYALPQELRAVLRSNNKALPAISGDETWEFPIPATNVIARNGRVAPAYLDVDYRKRLDPEAIVAGLRFAGA